VAEQTEHQRALEQFKLVVETEQDQRRREQEDLRFDAGEQWPEDIVALRSGLAGNQGQPATPPRPMITIRTLDQPTAQIVNQARNARFAIKISPKSDANEQTAEAIQGLIRAIEYDSSAQTAYLWAYQRAVTCGRGYFRINKRYALSDPDDTEPSPALSDQELVIEMILNGASVYLDPWAQALNDPAAAEWGYITEDIPKSRYDRKYGETKLASMDDGDLVGLGDYKDQWVMAGENGEVSYRIAERFWTVFEDTKVGDRTITKRRVMWAKMNGVEFIEPPQEWDGKFIPIVPVVGVEKNIGGKRLWEGIVRPNIGPCRMINYLVSSDAENMGTVTKSPWLVVAGQLEGFEDQWRSGNTRLQPWQEYHAMTDATGSTILPPPARNIPEVPVSNEAIGLYVNFVRSTTGVPDAALGHVNPNDKSGKAINALQQASEQGTSNFPDHLQRAIRHGACIALDLLPKVYDRPGRIANILTGQDDQQSKVMLNAPFVRQQGQPVPAPPGSQPGQPAPPMPGQPPPQPPQPGQPPTPPPMVEQIDLAKGQYSVVVETGKSFATQKGEERDGLLGLADAVPELVPKFADLLVKAIGGPQAEAVADRLKPPGVDEGLPPQIQQAMGQLQQENQQLKMMLQTKHLENQATLEKAQMDNQARMQQTQMDNDTRVKVAEINTSATLAAVQQKIDAENARTFVEAMEKRIADQLGVHLQHVQALTDAIAQGHSQGHEAGMAAMGHTHDLAAGQQAHQQTLDQADQAHQQALTQGDQAHQQALAQGDQGHQQALEQQAAQPAPNGGA
jgi:Phage P22-like portal protein